MSGFLHRDSVVNASVVKSNILFMENVFLIIDTQSTLIHVHVYLTFYLTLKSNLVRRLVRIFKNPQLAFAWNSLTYNIHLKARVIP